MIRDQRKYGNGGGVSSTVKAIVEAIVPLKVITTSQGNGADTTEDILGTFSIPANTLGANGVQGFEIEAWGTFGANADNKQVKLYFGTTVLASGVVTDNAKNWRVVARVLRTGANAQVVVGQFLIDVRGINPTVTTATEVETGALVTKVTGQDSTAATANSIVLKAFTVRAIEQSKTT